MKEKKFIRAALAEALKGQHRGEVPVGAVVVYQNKIIARAQNTREQKQSPIGHAEINAIAKAAKKLGTWRLENCDVYITLEPCPMCAGALQQARVRSVYFGVFDPKGGCISLNLNLNQNTKLNHQYEMKCLEEAECGQILSAFFKAKRKTKS